MDKNENNQEINGTLESLKKNYAVVERSFVRPWQIWLGAGLLIGVFSAVFFIANRNGKFEFGRAAIGVGTVHITASIDGVPWTDPFPVTSWLEPCGTHSCGIFKNNILQAGDYSNQQIGTYYLVAYDVVGGPPGLVLQDLNGMPAKNSARISTTLADGGTLNLAFHFTRAQTPDFRIAPASTVIGEGGKINHIQGMYYDPDASLYHPDYIESELITWTTSNPAVATVSATQGVIGKSAGMATIVGAYKGLSATMQVTVSGQVKSYNVTTSDGRVRTYLLYVPSGYRSGTSTPLVFNFHGGGGNGQWEMDVYQMNPIADKNTFLVAYPDGISRTWNGGTCCGEASRENIDDVAFVKKMVEKIQSEYTVDRSRIYSTGMSNGAIFSHRLACELFDVIAAIAPVAGGMNMNDPSIDADFSSCRPARQVSIMEFHGTTDENYPYIGGVGNDSISKVNFYSIPQTISGWLDRYEISPSSKIISYQRGIETCETYKNNKNTEVTLCTARPQTSLKINNIFYDGGGHAIPGGLHSAVDFDVPTQDISAAEAVWAFFKAHPKTSAGSAAVRVGDPNANYNYTEFTLDNKYMVWLEMKTDGSGTGTVWHCAVNPDTAEFIPADCRGFKAFDSTDLTRGSPGMDSKGSYYVGADLQNRLIIVRPTGATTGDVTVLSTVPDFRRRAIYPSMLPGSSKGYVFWILNQRVAGGGTDKRNAWVELQYIDLADPTNVKVIERQNRPATGFAPMDSAFARWFVGKASITFGSYVPGGKIEIKEYDLSGSTPVSRFVTNDGHAKADPFPWVFGNTEVLMPGIDGKALTYIYTRPLNTAGFFTVAEMIAIPSSTKLLNPILAQSNERIEWGGKAYTAYQVNDGGTDPITGIFDIMLRSGEIWFSTVMQAPQRQWLLSADDNLIKIEPEPYMGNSKAWVFYSAAPTGGNFRTTQWSLWRAEAPLIK